jgi:hypothetical protein
MSDALKPFQQLRGLRAQIQKPKAEKMAEALEHVLASFESGASARRSRLLRGLIAFHGAGFSFASWIGSQSFSSQPLVKILSFLRYGGVGRLSVTCRSLERKCRVEDKLRVPSLTAKSVERMICGASATDVVTLEISMKVGILSGRDMHRLAGWLRNLRSSTFGGFSIGHQQGVESRRLQELYLSDLQLKDSDPDGNLLAQIITNSNLRIIDVSGNGLSDIAIEKIAYALRVHAPGLEEVNLDNNCTSSIGLAAILLLGCGKGRMCKWGLRHNKVGDDGCRTLAEAGKLQAGAWDLRTNGIGADGCFALAHSAAFGCMLTVKLGCNPLRDLGARYLAKGIGTTLQVLELRQAQISDQGAIDLGLSLARALSLRELLLAGNHIEGIGAGALAKGCALLESLTRFELSNNPLGSHGVEKLAQAIPDMHQAGVLVMSIINVDCEDSGGNALRSVLRANRSLCRKFAIELKNNRDLSSAIVADIMNILDGTVPCSWVRQHSKR